jgi:hypothetical protein
MRFSIKAKFVITLLVVFNMMVLSILTYPLSPGGPSNPVTNTIAYPSGWPLVANPLFHSRGEFVSNSVPDNTVAKLFARLPNRTVLLKFDNATQRFAPRDVFWRGRWSKPDQTLVPGEGA